MGELGDKVELDLADRAETRDQVGIDTVPAGLAFVLADEGFVFGGKAVLRAFLEETCLPSSVTGPRDFAPLMRAASDFVIRTSSPGCEVSMRVCGFMGCDFING